MKVVPPGHFPSCWCLNSFLPETVRETANIPVPHGAKSWGRLTLPALHFIWLLLYQWVTVTMETSEFLHITGEPGCQQPRLWRMGVGLKQEATSNIKA